MYLKIVRFISGRNDSFLFGGGYLFPDIVPLALGEKMYAQIYFDGRASPLYAACLPACLPAMVDMNFRAARSCTCIPTIALGRPYPPRLSRCSGAQTNSRRR